MAWRPHEYLIEGRLDNTQPGKVTGWLAFHGLLDLVVLDLSGDFHRDIRGASIRVKGINRMPLANGTHYLAGFSPQQCGQVGDITAGLMPFDYGDMPYIEWYSGNGRVVLELERQQVEVIGTPIPWQNSEPVSRKQQAQNMAEFLESMSVHIGKQFANSTND